MKRFKERLGLASLLCASLAILMSYTPASAWDRGNVEIFAVLPAGTPTIEGLTVGQEGNVYVTTFDPRPTATPPAQLFVFNDNGKQLRQVAIQGSTAATLGLAFHPSTQILLVIDFGAGNVRSVDPQSGASSVCITVTSPPQSPGLNALTFDAAGNTYISDSFNGIIWKKTGAGCGPAVAWVTDPLLLPNGVPPFGANGVGFNKAETALFVANTSTDLLVKIPVTGGTPGAPQAFTYSINGADGIVLDNDDNIWVAANQGDEIVVVDPTGKAIAKLGDFDGVKNGVTRGLLFPASPDFSKDGKWLFVTNLELDLRSIGGPQTVDSQWAAQVQQHSIARLRAHIPPLAPRN
jgi:sugar lactone lactonase YvrE